MHHLLDALATYASSLIQTFGHFGVFLAMTLESACIPLPSEVIMLFSGYEAHVGILSYSTVIIVGVLGNVVGSIITYWIGAIGGRPFLSRYGRYILINEKHIDSADRWFQRFGEWAVFFGRLLPVVRTFISLPAGVARMNFGRFVLFTLIGCVPFDWALTWLGFKLGANWNSVEPHIKPISYGILAVVVLLILWFFVKHMSKRQAALSKK